jgi:hypothetical protein
VVGGVGIVAVLLVTLWVRSYWSNDQLRFTYPILCYFFSENGRLSVTLFPHAGGYYPATDVGRGFETSAASQKPWAHRWFFDTVDDVVYAACPHWLPACLFALLVAFGNVGCRFSLRTLLIATTLVAVGLGLIVWFSSAH